MISFNSHRAQCLSYDTVGITCHPSKMASLSLPEPVMEMIQANTFWQSATLFLPERCVMLCVRLLISWASFRVAAIMVGAITSTISKHLLQTG
jgi:hypothetical protein